MPTTIQAQLHVCTEASDRLLKALQVTCKAERGERTFSGQSTWPKNTWKRRIGDDRLNPWAVVTSGPSPNSLGVVQGLARSGIPIALVDLVPDSPARYSRSVETRLECREYGRNSEALIPTLVNFAEQQEKKPVLIMTGDSETLIVAQNLEKVKRHYHVLLPEAVLVQSLLDKACFSRMLCSMGIPHPRTQPAANLEDLKQLVEEEPFPIVLKPTSSGQFTDRFRQKLFFIRSHSQIKAALEALRDWPCDMMVQEWIPASYHYEVYLLRTRRQGIRAISGWDRLRQFPPGFGSASYCRTVRREEAVTAAIDLVERLDYQGVAAIEFISDSRDGDLKMIEVNPRTTLQNRLSAAAGVDTELLLYRTLLGEEYEQLVHFREGVFWIDNIKESISRIIEFRRNEYRLHQFVGDVLTPKIHSLRSWRDPLPMAASLTQAVTRSVGWLKTRRMFK